MTDEELNEAQFSLAIGQFGDAISRLAKFAIARGHFKAWLVEEATDDDQGVHT